jgi:hypothetical protein
MRGPEIVLVLVLVLVLARSWIWGEFPCRARTVPEENENEYENEYDLSGRQDSPRPIGAALDLALSRSGAAADGAHQQLVAADVELEHLDVPAVAGSEQGAVELLDPWPDEHHPRRHLVARVRVPRRGEREAIPVCHHHGLNASVFAARGELVPEGLRDRLGTAAPAFCAHGAIVTTGRAGGKKTA